MAQIQIEVDDSRVRAALQRLSRRMRDLQPVMEDIGAYVERSTDKRFRDERDPDNRPWAPLAQSTLKQKKNRKILNEFGQMRSSLAYEASSNEVSVGFSDQKARWHQLGTKPRTIAPRNKRVLRFVGASGSPVFAKRINHPGLPARRMLGINQEDEQEIIEIIADHTRNEWGA